MQENTFSFQRPLILNNEIKQPNKNQNQINLALKKTIKSKPDEYKLVFHSKSILFAQSLSQYLFQQLLHQKSITLLINFYQQEIDQIFNKIVTKKSQLLLKNIKLQRQIEHKRLNQVIKAKRAQYYKTSGVYSLSAEVLIKDLLRFQKIIDLNNINRIIFRISQKIVTFLNYYGWIFTMLKKQTKNCSVLIFCREVQYYGEFQNLEGIYRTFFCQKIVLWPFGRAQVHKSILNANSKFAQFKHYIQMTQQMKKNQQILKRILQIIQKQYNKFRIKKINGLQLLFKQIITTQLQVQSPQHYELKDFRNIRFLFNCILNCDSVTFLSFFLHLRFGDHEKSIWNSSNSVVNDLFAQIQDNTKSRIYSFSKVQQNKQKGQKLKQTDLAQLIMNYYYDAQQNQIALSYDQFQALYQLQYRIDINLTKSHKISQISQIIDSILYQLQIKSARYQEGKTSKKDQQDFQNILISDQNNFQPQNLLILCPNQTIQKYLHKQLFMKINNSSYMQYLRSLYGLLSIERSMRIMYIKTLYNRIKVKKSYQKMEVQGQEKQNKQKINNIELIGNNSKLNNQQQKREISLDHGKQFQEMKQKLKESKQKAQKQNYMVQFFQQNFTSNSLQNSKSSSDVIQSLMEKQNQNLNQFSQLQIEKLDSQQNIQQQFSDNKNENILLQKQKNENLIVDQKQAKIYQKQFNYDKLELKNTPEIPMKYDKQQTLQKVMKNKSKKPPKQIFKQNRIILQQVLFKELSILFEIISRYQSNIFTDEQLRMNPSIKKHQNKAQKAKPDQKQNFNKKESQQKQHKIYKSQEVKEYFAPQQASKDLNTFQTNKKVISMLQQQNNYFQKNFYLEISKINFQYLNKNQIKIVPNYYDEAQLCWYDRRSNSNKNKLLIVTLFSPKLGSNSDKVMEFNQSIRLINPQRCILYSPHTFQTRNLYITHSQGLLPKLKELRVLAFKDSFQVLTAENQVKTEDQAFWKISQNRLKLHEYKQNAELRIQQLQMDDKYQKTVDFIGQAIKNDHNFKEKSQIYRMNLNQRRIIVDSRQFKSALPCYLYFYGFTVIPVQLQTADYILSDQIGIQKKSVQTKDLHMSLRSFRLDKQIQRMCLKFQKPILLIQCQDPQEFRKQSFFDKGISQAGMKDVYRIYIRQRLGQLMKKYPKLRIIWSDSVSRSCDYFKQLKRDQPQPQIGKFLKNQSQETQKGVEQIFASDDEQSQMKQKQEIDIS